MCQFQKSRQIVQQHHCVLQVGHVEAFRESAVKRGKEIVSLWISTLGFPKPSQIGRGTPL